MEKEVRRSRMEERKKRQQRAERAVWVLLLALLIFWSLPLAGKGIDVRDTGSYL